MFGYVRIRKPELKVKDYETYHGFYCGLCHCLKKRYGFLGQMTLTYDMTFLVILLTSVYDMAVETEEHHCVVHPVQKHRMIESEISAYAADMNMILGYYQFADDKADGERWKGSAGMALYNSRYKKSAERYPKQCQIIQETLQDLAELEQVQCQDVKLVADTFGRLMSGLFTYKEDAFTRYLQDFGYHLGCFIYIMDAYDDVKEDIEKERYNPFREAYTQDEQKFQKQVHEMLLDEIAAAGAAFEQLPCLEYVDILRNIIYAGIWNRYDDIQTQEHQSK